MAYRKRRVRTGLGTFFLEVVAWGILLIAFLWAIGIMAERVIAIGAT